MPLGHEPAFDLGPLTVPALLAGNVFDPLVDIRRQNRAGAGVLPTPDGVILIIMAASSNAQGGAIRAFLIAACVQCA